MHRRTHGRMAGGASYKNRSMAARSASIFPTVEGVQPGHVVAGEPEIGVTWSHQGVHDRERVRGVAEADAMAEQVDKNLEQIDSWNERKK